MSYAEDLKHPKWQRKRLEIMQRDEWQCTGCESDDKPLHVHHRRYIPGRKPWEYADEDLVTLCKDCHQLYHAVNDRFKDMAWDEKLDFLGKLIPDGSSKLKAGPFLIFDSPKMSPGCIIFHVPSGCWHSFTLTSHQALQMFKSRPEARQELLQIILEGASAQWKR